MAMIFTQTDTNGVCGTANYCKSAPATNDVQRQASVGGTAGSTPVSFSLASSATEQISFELIVPAGATGSSGTWTVRLNVTTANMNISAENGAICRVNSSCVNQQTVVGDSAHGLDPSSTGTKTWSVSGNAVTLAAGDKIIVVLAFLNGAMSTQAFSFTPSLDIDSPFTAAVVFVAPPPKLITQQSRNRASLY